MSDCHQAKAGNIWWCEPLTVVPTTDSLSSRSAAPGALWGNDGNFLAQSIARKGQQRPVFMNSEHNRSFTKVLTVYSNFWHPCRSIDIHVVLRSGRLSLPSKTENR